MKKSRGTPLSVQLHKVKSLCIHNELPPQKPFNLIIEGIFLTIYILLTKDVISVAFYLAGKPAFMCFIAELLLET